MEIRRPPISFAETLIMRYFPIAILFLFLVGCNSTDKKPAEEKVESQHSPAFNKSFDVMMNDYYALSESFVNWDSNAVKTKTSALENSLRALSLDDLKGDTATYATANETAKNAAATAGDIAKAGDITSSRRGFHALTQNIFDLLRAVKYDEKKLYLQECPMAFNDTETGIWLTDKGKDSIRNPYLGLHHPKYGGEMIDCGSNISVINFVGEAKPTKEKHQVDEKVDTSHSKGRDKN